MTTDPFESLRLPDQPVDPDPAFATRLRRRLEDALAAPTPPTHRATGDDAVTDSPTPTAEQSAQTTAADQALSPYLSVAGAREALAWYADVLGAVPDGDPIVMGDGRIGHAQLRLGPARIMLADEFPDQGFLGPTARGGTSVSLHLEVADVDRTAERAVAAGATLERPPSDQFHGSRSAVVVDPWGHRWMLNATVEHLSDDEYRRRVEDGGMHLERIDLGERATAATPATPDAATAAAGDDGRNGRREGDVAYFTVHTRDDDRAAAFYGAVLGWQTSPGNVEGGRQIDGVVPMGGIWGRGDDQQPEIRLMFRVDDVDAAVARVRTAGGTATDPEDQPYGRTAECVDDQGLAFELYQPPV